MLSNRKVRYRKKQRTRTLSTGDLLDVSETARACGIEVPVAISRAVWTSLIKPFPGARPEDLLSLDALLQDIACIVLHEFDGHMLLSYCSPSLRPKWLSKNFAMRVEVVAFRGRPESIVICTESESFFSGKQKSLTALPGALLWRLRLTVFDLGLVARPAESRIVERIEGIVAAMLRANPVGQCIEDMFSGLRPSLYAFLSPEEYRWLLLHSFAELLVCLGACPGHENTIAMLVAQNRAMISPLSDLTVITEGLMKITNRLLFEQESLGNDPFTELLAAYHGMRNALDRSSTYISASLLQSIRSQLQSMSTRVKRADEGEFERLSQWFHSIDRVSDPGAVVDLSSGNDPSLIWQ